MYVCTICMSNMTLIAISSFTSHRSFGTQHQLRLIDAAVKASNRGSDLRSFHKGTQFALPLTNGFLNVSPDSGDWLKRKYRKICRKSAFFP